MAREVHSFEVTIPAGTAKASPQVTDLAMPPRVVVEVEVVVPPGPRGKVGFQLGAAGVQMLPYQPGTFFVADHESIRWPLEGQISSGAWQLIAYNTGFFAHTLEVRFLVDLPATAEAGGPVVLVGAEGLPSPEVPAVLTGSEVPLAFLGFGG
jgi:hypothetical protein